MDTTKIDDQFDEMARIALDACAVARICGNALERIALLGGPAGQIAADALREVKAATLDPGSLDRVGVPNEFVRSAEVVRLRPAPAALVIAVAGERPPYDWERELGDGRR